MREITAIHYRLYSPITGELIRKGKVTTRKGLRRAKERADLNYGAYLRIEAEDQNGEQVFCAV